MNFKSDCSLMCFAPWSPQFLCLHKEQYVKKQERGGRVQLCVPVNNTYFRSSLK